MAMMIQKFHRLIQSRVFWILFLGLVAFSMVFFGVILPDSNYTPQQEIVPEARFKGKDIDYREFNHHRNQAYLKLTFRTLEPPRRTPEVEEALREMAWQRMATVKKAEDLGLTVSDAEVRAAIQTNPLFADDAGNFSPATYSAFSQQYLPQLGINARVFEEHVREEVLIQKMQYLVYQVSVVSPLDVNRRFSMLRDNFKVEYGVLTLADIDSTVDVTEEDALAYFEENQEDYRIPDQVEVQFVQFDHEDYLTDDLVIDEEDIQTFYEENIDRFTFERPEEDDQAEDIQTAEAEEEDAAEETSEEDVVADTSESSEADMADADTDAESEDTDASDPFEFPEIADFELPGDEFNVPEVTTLSLDEAREEILTVLRKQEALSKARAEATEFVMAMASTRKSDGIPFPDAASKFEKDIISIAPFRDGEVLHGMDSGIAFVSAAFTLSDNPEESFSDAVLGENAIYVMELVERIDSHIPEFSEVENRVYADARIQILADTIEAKGDEIAEAAREGLKNGKPFTDIMKTYGIYTEVTETFNSTEGLEDNPLSTDLRMTAFEYNTGEVCNPVITENGVLISHVIERTPADPTMYGALQPQITTSVRRRNFQLLYESFMNQLLVEGNFQTREDIEAENAESDEAAADEAKADA